MIDRLVCAALAVACAAALLSGCAPSPVATPTPTPRFTSEAQAFAAAEATYRAYVDATNAVRLDQPSTFEGIFALTTGRQNADDKKALTSYHASGTTVSGSSHIVLLQPRRANDRAGSVQLDACLDVTTVEVTDSAGKSLVSPDRVDVQSLLISLKADSNAPHGMLITAIDGRDGSPTCG